MKKISISIILLIIIYFLCWALYPYIAKPTVEWESGIGNKEKTALTSYIEKKEELWDPVKYRGIYSVKRIFSPGRWPKQYIIVREIRSQKFEITRVEKDNYNEFEQRRIVLENNSNLERGFIVISEDVSIE